MSEPGSVVTNAAPRLHLGCGECYLDGYINIDFPPDQHSVQLVSRADLHADIRLLDYPGGSIAEVRAHHLFEHFDRPTALALLIRWQGWLQLRGRLLIETPDFARSVRAFLLRRNPRVREVILRHLYGSQEAAWAYHLDGWYRQKFERYLSALGFDQLRFEFGKWKDTYNITVHARKARVFDSSDEAAEVADTLLEWSMVDRSESELRMLSVWKTEMRRRLAANTHLIAPT
jgi:predicted SAM-dependent methyltransferase